MNASFGSTTGGNTQKSKLMVRVSPGGISNMPCKSSSGPRLTDGRPDTFLRPKRPYRSSACGIRTSTAEMFVMRFLARMYARFLGGPAMQGSWFRCGISPGLARFTAVWSLNRPPAARAPLLGGGPARRQPLPPQGADATTLMSLRPVKVLESLGLIFLDGHCWPGASLSAKAPRNWLAAAFRPLPRPEVRAGLESLLRYETVEESLK